MSPPSPLLTSSLKSLPRWTSCVAPGNHSSPWQPHTPPTVIARVYYYEEKCNSMNWGLDGGGGRGVEGGRVDFWASIGGKLPAAAGGGWRFFYRSNEYFCILSSVRYTSYYMEIIFVHPLLFALPLSLSRSLPVSLFLCWSYSVTLLFAAAV